MKEKSAHSDTGANGELPSFIPTTSTTTLTTTTASLSQGGVSPQGEGHPHPADCPAAERPSSLIAPHTVGGKWPDPPSATDTASSTCGGRRWLLCVSTNNGTGPPGEQYQPFSAPVTPAGEASSNPVVCSGPRTLSSCSLTACFLGPSSSGATSSNHSGSPSPPPRGHTSSPSLTSSELLPPFPPLPVSAVGNCGLGPPGEFV